MQSQTIPGRHLRRDKHHRAPSKRTRKPCPESDGPVPQTPHAAQAEGCLYQTLWRLSRECSSRPLISLRKIRAGIWWEAYFQIAPDGDGQRIRTGSVGNGQRIRTGSGSDWVPISKLIK